MHSNQAEQDRESFELQKHINETSKNFEPRWMLQVKLSGERSTTLLCSELLDQPSLAVYLL